MYVCMYVRRYVCMHVCMYVAFCSKFSLLIFMVSPSENSCLLVFPVLTCFVFRTVPSSSLSAPFLNKYTVCSVQPRTNGFWKINLVSIIANCPTDLSWTLMMLPDSQPSSATEAASASSNVTLSPGKCPN